MPPVPEENKRTKDIRLEPHALVAAGAEKVSTVCNGRALGLGARIKVDETHAAAGHAFHKG